MLLSMCGISGIIALKTNNTIDENILLKMTRVIQHRGPDEEGIYCRESVGLGARRLSIIDVGGRTTTHHQ